MCVCGVSEFYVSRGCLSLSCTRIYNRGIKVLLLNFSSFGALKTKIVHNVRCEKERERESEGDRKHCYPDILNDIFSFQRK